MIQYNQRADRRVLYVFKVQDQLIHWKIEKKKNSIRPHLIYSLGFYQKELSCVEYVIFMSEASQNCHLII